MRTPTEREKLAEPTCYAAIQYVLLGRPLALPAEVLARFPSHQCPPFWEILEVAGEGHPHSIDEDIVLHVRNPTPAHYSSRPAGRAPCRLGDEPIRGYVPLLMRSWIMQAGYSTAPCHLGMARTLRMLERFLVGRNEHVHPLMVAPWLEVLSAEDTATEGLMTHHFYSPPSGAGHCGKRGLFWAKPVTPRCNTYIFLFTDRFSRRADMVAVTAAEFTAEATANIRINRYISLWGCPRSMLLDNGLQFSSKLSHVLNELLGVEKIATGSYHLSDNGGVEHVSHIMTQMLTMVVNERQKRLGCAVSARGVRLQQLGQCHHWPGP